MGTKATNRADLVAQIAVALCILGITMSSADGLHCKNKPGGSDDLEFDGGLPANFQFVCENGHVDLHCCMTGFSRVQWYMYRIYREEWVPVDGSLDSYEFRDSNQTLRILDATAGRDRTNFSCVGYGLQPNEARLSENITVHFADCSPSQPSQFVYPSESPVREKTALGVVYRKKCTVWFGKGKCLFGCNVFWMRQYNNDSMPQHISTDNNTRVRYTEENRPQPHGGRFGDATLYVSAVTDEDFEGRFICGASGFDSDQLPNLILSLQETPPDPVPAFVTSVIVLAVIIVIALAVVAIGYPQRIKLRIWYKQRRRKPLNDSRQVIFVLYNSDEPEDESFVQETLEPLLRDTFQFDVSTQHHFEYGHTLFNNYSRALEQSSVMVVVVSRALLKQSECTLCIQHAINTGHRTVYVIRQQLDGGSGEHVTTEREEDTYRDIAIAVSTGPNVLWPPDGDDDGQLGKTEDKDQKYQPSACGTCRRGEISPEERENRLHLHLLTQLECDSSSKSSAKSSKLNCFALSCTPYRPSPSVESGDLDVERAALNADNDSKARDEDSSQEQDVGSDAPLTVEIRR